MHFEKKDWGKRTEEIIKESNGIYIYGAGNWGCTLVRFCVQNSIIIKAILVSDTAKNMKNIYGIPVVKYDDGVIYDSLIVVAVEGVTGNNISNILRQDGHNSVLQLSSIPQGFSGYEYNEKLQKEYYKDELKVLFWQYSHEELELDSPKTFNEKIQKIKLCGENSLLTQLADKYSVRQWVRDRIGDEYLIPLLGVWNNSNDINFDLLPSKFVLKCNHGCQFNYIVDNKASLSVDDVRKTLDSWMKTNYAYKSFEMQYKDIKPCIIAEEYIENESRELYDYKFWCFNGKVEFIMFLSERKNGLKMNNYDTNWSLLPFTYNYPNSDEEIKKPQNLDKMIKVAETLSEGMEFVRVDLYLLNDGTIKFGEMTFTPASGFCNWSDSSINLELGNKIL